MLGGARELDAGIGGIRRPMDGLANPLIRPASAQVAVHRLRDLLVGRVRILFQQRGRRHNLSCLAVAALRDILGDPCRLQDVELIGREAGAGRKPLDRRNALTGDLRQRNRARTDGVAVDVHRAGATKSRAATEFRSGKPEGLAQDPEERRCGRNGDSLLTSVYAERDIGHVSPVVGFGSSTTWYSTCRKREMGKS